MLFLKVLLSIISFGFLAGAIGTVAYDIYLAFQLDRILRRNDSVPESESGGTTGSAASSGASSGSPSLAQSTLRAPTGAPQRRIRWVLTAKLVALAAVTSLASKSLVVVPDGHAGVRVSQISGVRAGTLYPGTHLIFPLTERVVLYDVRDQVFSTAASTAPKEKLEVLNVESREGLSVGLALTVRYRIDPARLAYIQANLPQPIDQEIVEPVVASTFRDLSPNYIVRDLFSIKRGEYREKATQTITSRLAEDGIVVKEVLLRKVELPQEYARGLEGLLEKEQEDDRTSVDAQIEQKKVKIAESQAEAAKVRQIKHAEADAQSRVLMAKAESDSMQYTLPLKQKQIEQSKLEAQARKEATVENAEAAAESKVIDSKAEVERRKLLAAADAETTKLNAAANAQTIRLTAAADAERLQGEAAVLKQNPMLIQKIIAERLSDKLQIIMVPTDGRNFFASDVLRSAFSGATGASNTDDADPDSSAPARKQAQILKTK